jgi:hypothetical protein
MRTTTTALSMSEIRSLATATEARVSVYLDLWPADPAADASEDVDLRWRRLAAQLARQGADEGTLEAVGRDLTGQPATRAQYAIFARRGAVLHREVLPGLAGADRARFGAPAHVVPLLAFLQQHPPYVEVVTDRTGAEVTAVPGGGVDGSTVVVVGPDDEIERNAPGGWAQARYQHRAEDSWQHNAVAVAQEVTRAVDEVDAGLLLVAGDVRAVQLLNDHLPTAIRHRVVIRLLPGGRQPDSSETVRLAAAASAIADLAGTRTATLLDRLDTERRRGGLSVEGAIATLSALAEGRAHTLIVVDDPADERIAWFGPDTLCAHAPSRPGQATSWQAAGRLVDIAVRAAVLTDAEIHVLALGHAQAPAEGVGALCRFLPTAS